MVATGVLLLADGRFPAGGHAHSGGLEPAVAGGRVRDVADLRAFLVGKLATNGLVAAAFAASACHWPDAAVGLNDFEEAFCARTPSKAVRAAARKQGRALCRAALAIWPTAAVSVAARHPGGVSQPVAMGVVAAAAGLSAGEAASVMAFSTVSGAASAAVRLLGLDPYAVHALLAELSANCDEVAARAATYAERPLAELPAASAPWLDVAAEDHATWEVRLYAS